MRKLYLLLYILLLGAVHAGAQRVSLDLRDVTMPAALQQLGSMTTRYTINFIYNDLEDFRVTTAIRGETVPEAIRHIIGFYPISMTMVGDSIINVECVQKEALRYKGRVVDEKGEAAVFANVVLLSPADSSIIGSGVSNEDGYFVIPCEARRVIARISYVGYKTIRRAFASPMMGVIRIETDSRMLKGVTVKALRPQYKQVKGGVVVDVEHSLLSKVGTATDVLAQLPRVNVVQDGSVSVFGKGTPEIYINNKLVRDSKELTELKSSDIRSAEVITNPGAQYNAAVKSVIRLNVKKPQGEGWGISASSNLRNNTKWGGYEQLDLKYRHKGLEFFGSCLFNNTFMGEDNDLTSTMQFSDHTLRTVTNADDGFRSSLISPKVGFSYDLSDSQSLGATYSVSKTLKGRGNTINEVENVWRDGVLQGAINQDASTDITGGPDHNVNLYYIGKVGKLGIDFNGTYLWKKDGRDDAWIEKSSELNDRNVQTQNQRHSHMLAGKLIVSYDHGGNSVSVGVEATRTHTQSVYDITGGDVDDADTKIDESNVAPFASYSLQWGHWSLDAGLRYEHVSTDYYSYGVLEEEPSKTYNDLFPNVSLAWNKNLWGLSLSYTKKIERPSYFSLRNNVQYGGRYLYDAGNPYLQPTIEHNVELNASYNWLNFSMGYDYDKDYIAYFSTLFENHEAALARNINIGHYQDIYVSVTASPKFGWYQPTLEADLSKPFFNATKYGSEERLNSVSMSASLRNRLVFSKTCFATVYLEYNTRACSDFLKTRTSGTIDLSFTQSLFHDALLVNVYANDLLKTRRSAWTQYGRYVITNKDCYEYTRQIGLTVTYHFNVSRSKYKGKGAGNDEKNRL